jgi:hypothetical protein
MVTISVGRGDEKKNFIIHSKLICHCLEFFSKAFNGPFIEGQNKHLTMEETAPGSFNLFFTWLYSQKVWGLASPAPTSIDLIDLWILADMALIPRLQNETLKHIDLHRAIDRRAPLEKVEVDHIWEDTGEGSAIRAYIVDEIVRGKLKVGDPRLLPQETLAELFTARGDIIVGSRIPLLGHEMAKYLVEEVLEKAPQVLEPEMINVSKKEAENAG